MSVPVPLAEQQQLLRDAIDILNLREIPTEHIPRIVHTATIGLLQQALGDHEDPSTGCLADPGEDCISVATARAILAGDQ